MNLSTLKFFSKLSIIILCIIGLAELGLALWTVLDNRYKSLAYNLADVGYIDLWILRYLSLCLFTSSIITLVMCLILIWGLYSAHVLLFIASTMIFLIVIGEFVISMLTFTHKYETRLTLTEQLPKLVITYRQGTEERARRALDVLQLAFRCCGADGRLSFQNNVPLSCNMFYIGCLTRTTYFLDACMDTLAYLLLIFSLIKLFIVLFFYTFLCAHRQKRTKKAREIDEDVSINRHSSSLNSSVSSTDNLPRKTFVLAPSPPRPRRNDYQPNENEYVEQQRSLINEYDSTVNSNRRVRSPSNESTTYYEQNPSRKLSSISEKTEKTETDDSETDLAHLKYMKPRRKPMITTIHQPQHPPVLPPNIKSRRKILRDDEHDSGVEHSSSERSFDDHNLSPPVKSRSPSSLTFSKVFITSVSQKPPTDDELKKPLTSSSNSLNFHGIITPKSILKKTPIYTKTSPLLMRIPKPIPRTNTKQNETLC